jgi:hypothetical protein
MPLQNRVSPAGDIFADPARGTFMGNRGGAIHDGERRIIRPYASRRWITCVLEFKGRRRPIMTPGRYTELFFLDEAVSLAAGHRPCAECRRERFNAFKDAWIRAGNRREGGFLYADLIDEELHRAHIHRERPRQKSSETAKVTGFAELISLPDGCLVRIAGADYLVWADALFRWSPRGYVERRERPNNLIVTVLTPQPIVLCLGHGYTPEIHYSAGNL